MKVKYTHISAPDKVKIYDTAEVLKNNPFIKTALSDFDQQELERFQKDKEKGIVLSFEVIK